MLVLRVRMPIVADLVYPRNFITKIIRYDKASAVSSPYLQQAGQCIHCWSQQRPSPLKTLCCKLVMPCGSCCD